jgi:hypothetical protein
MGKGALSKYLYVTLSRISFGGAILEIEKNCMSKAFYHGCAFVCESACAFDGLSLYEGNVNESLLPRISLALACWW